MVAGMVHGSWSAIFFMVPRRILPERVLGRRCGHGVSYLLPTRRPGRHAKERWV
jgi:hypothetical protein